MNTPIGLPDLDSPSLGRSSWVIQGDVTLTKIIGTVLTSIRLRCHISWMFWHPLFSDLC